MGSVVFSVDAELAWGFTNAPTAHDDRLESARDGWQWLLSTFDAYRVPATWAVVGHLCLDDPDEVDGAVLDAPGERNDRKPDGRERNGLADDPDLRYAPDLVDAVVESPVEHDVGSHSFAHARFDHPGLARTGARADVDAAVDALATHGVDPESFVFPHNAVGHREVLAEHGFRAYRQPPPERTRVGAAASKCAAVLDPERVPLVEPTVDEYGLVGVPPSLFLFGFEGVARAICTRVWTDPIVRQARRAIDRAATEDGVCHVWLHPNDLVTLRDRQRVRAVVAHAARRRDHGEVDVETLADVADRILESDSTERSRPTPTQ